MDKKKLTKKVIIFRLILFFVMQLFIAATYNYEKTAWTIIPVANLILANVLEFGTYVIWCADDSDYNERPCGILSKLLFWKEEE